MGCEIDQVYYNMLVNEPHPNSRFKHKKAPCKLMEGAGIMWCVVFTIFL